jgi:GTPase SAR1 family protein
MEDDGEKKERAIVKIIILGSSNVGKSALIKRYTTGKFSDARQSTVGSDFMTKIIDLMGYRVVMQIWVRYN